MITPESLPPAADVLRNAREVVVFTGAGVSAESGIATFRDEDGFWQRFPPEDFANWAGLLKTAAVHPRRFTEFLLAVLEPIARAEPNAGHRAIAELEQHVSVTVVTQNIDGLHQAAGSIIVKEIHGTLFELVSTPGKRFVRLVTRQELLEIVKELHEAMASRATAVKTPLAIRAIFGPGAGGFHRPNLVLFGDAMNEPHWSQALEAARNCDVMISVGTSGIVYPASSLPQEAKAVGATVIQIDPAEPQGDIWLKGTACEILPDLLSATYET